MEVWIQHKVFWFCSQPLWYVWNSLRMPWRTWNFEEVFGRTSQHPQSAWGSTWRRRRRRTMILKYWRIRTMWRWEICTHSLCFRHSCKCCVFEHPHIQHTHTTLKNRYALHYPRTKRIRKGWLLRRVVEMVSISIIVVSMAQQWVLPTVHNAKFDELDVVHIAERVMKLAIPNMYVWLIGFYGFFHLYLNILSEITYFGDRLFYKDWWNSRSLDYFWSHWNLPVHHFMKRHIYVPLRKRGWSSVSVILLIFFISGVGHEIVLSVPFGSVKLWAVFGMMGQAPLCALTRLPIFRSTQFGNIVFWLSIMLGQPTLVLFYYYHYTHWWWWDGRLIILYCNLILEE